jgi:transposase
MRHLVITAPDQLRCRLKGLSVSALVSEAARLRPSRSGDPVMAAHKASLCSLARRIQGLEDEIAELDERIEKLLEAAAPELLARFGVGLDTAAAILVSEGDNPERLHSEAAWAHVCGVAPIPAWYNSSSRAWRAAAGDLGIEVIAPFVLQVNAPNFALKRSSICSGTVTGCSS